MEIIAGLLGMAIVLAVPVLLVFLIVRWVQAAERSARAAEQQAEALDRLAGTPRRLIFDDRTRRTRKWWGK
jgi:hypothetical protein